MRPPLLVIDVHYLCHRAFHSNPKELSWKGRATGVIFGFLKSISYLKDEFQTDQVAFCFEHPHLFRRDVYPPYKRRRHTKKKTPEEIKDYVSLVGQISSLHKIYLPQIGFKNVFCFRGMESDDIMAALARDCPDNEEAILVTGDADLLQCLRPNVHIYSPIERKLWTEDKFVGKLGITPPQWAVVKAIAGCKGDEVEGIRGVGDKSAIKYIKGELPQKTLQYQAITSPEGKAIVRRNRPLVQLPYASCPTPVLQQDCVTRQAWREVCGLLGMKSIAGLPPIATRKLNYGQNTRPRN